MQLSKSERVKGTKLVIGVEPMQGYTLVDIPALVGEDVCRRTGRLQLALSDGHLCHVGQWDDPIDLDPGVTICGWGHLDGPAYNVGSINRSVPSSVIEHLRYHHGLIVKVPAQKQ